MNRNQNKLVFFDLDELTSSAPSTGGKYFSHNALGLTDAVDYLSTLHLVTGNGGSARVSNFTIDMYIHCKRSFNLFPVIVQTAGTWTSNYNRSEQTIEELLAATINDIFGYSLLRKHVKYCRPAVPLEGSTGDPPRVWQASIHIPLPQHIVSLINKNNETEALQSLWFGLLGEVEDYDEEMYFNISFYIEYTFQRRNIIQNR
jgi:hypothetical protein